MKESIKLHKTMLKIIFRAVPLYLPVKLLNEIFQYLFYFIGILFTKYMLNCLINNNLEVYELVRNYGIYFGLGFLLSFFDYWCKEFFENFQNNRLNKEIKILILHKIAELDVADFENNEFFDKYSRVSDRILEHALENIRISVSVILSLLRIVTIVWLFVTLDFIFVVAALVLCLQTVFTTQWFDKFFYQAYIEDTPWNRKAGYITFIYQSINFVKELKIYQFYELLNQHYMEAKEKITDLKKSRVKSLIKLLFCTNLFGELVKIGIHFYVIIQIKNKNLSAGDFLVVFSTLSYLSNTLSDFIKLYPKLIMEGKYIKDFIDILESVPLISKNENGKILEKENSITIGLSHIEFAYPNRPDVSVLKDITMEIPFGSKVAIVGENGSGKTTLLKLIVYLYQQTQGKILCNGMEYQGYQTESIRSCFGTLFQDFQLYEISIAENVLMRTVEKEDEKLIWESLDFAGLADKIRSLEKGIYTELSMEFSEDGIYLSGGEQQKLAIARAYAREANVLVLDEPSSALDPIAEVELFKKIMKLEKKSTVIYISHRFYVTVDADRIYVLENGSIIEEGTHRELMMKKGKYYEMFQVQAETFLGERQHSL